MYFTGTISPVLISFEASLTRVGVSKLTRPIYLSSIYVPEHKFKKLAESFSPQTQAASAGAPAMVGNSFLVGNVVHSGSHGIVVAVLFIMKNALVCVNRSFAIPFLSAINEFSEQKRMCRIGETNDDEGKLL
jgi:hypothetical protein